MPTKPTSIATVRERPSPVPPTATTPTQVHPRPRDPSFPPNKETPRTRGGGLLTIYAIFAQKTPLSRPDF